MAKFKVNDKAIYKEEPVYIAKVCENGYIVEREKYGWYEEEYEGYTPHFSGKHYWYIDDESSLVRTKPKFKVGDIVKMSGSKYESRVIAIIYNDIKKCDCVVTIDINDGYVRCQEESKFSLVEDKEMTVEEINRALGYKVKIIEG